MQFKENNDISPFLAPFPHQTSIVYDFVGIISDSPFIERSHDAVSHELVYTLYKLTKQ